MADQTAKGDDLEQKAEKKLAGWGIFGSKYDDAADLFDKAANFFKLAKNCNVLPLSLFSGSDCGHAGRSFMMQLDSKHEAASTFVNAANCYKKISLQGNLHYFFSLLTVKTLSISADAAESLNQAVNLFLEIGRLNMAARYCKVMDLPWEISALDFMPFYIFKFLLLNTHIFISQELGELYELEQNPEKAMDYFERAADLFQSEEVTTSANQCNQKVAQFAAQLEQ
ncbi:hypothetical protein BHE74_00028436 [Ensete ventricosum]|nr:hypothetical protein GW17_00003002 [Ensete ventricosum]RWW64329.1 hypothetical protein BHE74_00028436 [Ensete ventricosum]